MKRVSNRFLTGNKGYLQNRTIRGGFISKGEDIRKPDGIMLLFGAQLVPCRRQQMRVGCSYLHLEREHSVALISVREETLPQRDIAS